jgi:hypothetical protein
MALLDADPRDPRSSGALPSSTVVDGGFGTGSRTDAGGAHGHGLTLAAAFTAAFALGGWKIGLERLHDNSFFVHLMTGQWILDHGIPHHDVYSFTAAGTHFIAESWLAEVAYGVLLRTVGPNGIRLVMGVCAMTVMVALYRLALRQSGDRLRAAALTLPAFAVVAAMWSERPLAFGLVALVAVVWMVEAPESRIGRSVMLALPIVMWCWVNVHGSFALGFLYIALHLAGRALDGAWPRPGTRERKLLVATAVSCVAVFVNPYGPSLVLFPVHLLGRGKELADVVEWMSPNFHVQAGASFAVFLVAALTVMVLGTQRPSRRDVLVMLPFLLLGFWALRNLAIASIVTLPIAARAAAVADDAPRRAPGSRRIATWSVAALVLLGLAFGLQALAQPAYQTSGFSVRAYRALVKDGYHDSRLFTTDANAGWMIAAHFPSQHVFMDDRYDMYPIKVIDDYGTISTGGPQWSALLDEYKIQTVIWPTTRSLTQLLAESPSWHRVYRDKAWTVFVRNH